MVPPVQLLSTPRRSLAGLLVFAGAGPAMAQDDAAAAVRAANTAFDVTVSARDLEALMALHLPDPGISAAHPRDRAVVVGPAAVRRSWEEAFTRFATLEVAMPQPVIQLFGDVAVVAGLETVAGRRSADGPMVRFEAMTTNVFHRRGGRWLMAHHHATMVPA